MSSNFCTPKGEKKKPSKTYFAKLREEHILSPAPVAHASPSSHSRGRDQEAHSLKPAWAYSPQYPISKKPFTKKGLVEWLKV
jgi:hypothetical protein